MAKVLELLASALDLHGTALSPESQFSEIGLTSMSSVKVIRGIQAHYGVAVSLKVLYQCRSVASLAQYIDAALEGEAPRFLVDAPLWLDEVEQEFAAVAVCDAPVVSATTAGTQSHHVLLTGATGYLGAFLLQELLETHPEEVSVYCIVRGAASDHAGAVERLVSHLQELQIFIRPDIFANRVRVLVGSLADGFDLDPAVYQELCGSVATVVHSAAHVNSVLPYSSLKQANVQGVRHVLKFAASGRCKHLVHISTMSVLTSQQQGRHEATDLAAHHATLNFTGGYNQSKWVGEMLVLRAAREKGHWVSVFRPGMISAHSTSGSSNENDFDTRLLAGLIKMGSAPYPSRAVLDQCPVDYVSRAIVRVSAGVRPPPSRDPLVCHFGNPHGSVQLDQMVDWLADMGYPLEKLAYADWLLQLATVPASNPLFPMVEGYFSGRMSFPHRSAIHEDQMANTLARAGPPPRITPKLFSLQLQWLASRAIIPSSQSRPSLTASTGSATITLDPDDLTSLLV